MSEEIQTLETYETQSAKFKQAWIDGRIAAEQAHKSVNNMVKILHIEHSNWSTRKVLNKISEDHLDLDGFSTQNLYKYLDDENRVKQKPRTIVSHDEKPKTDKKDPEQTPIPPKEPPQKEDIQIDDTTRFYKEQEPEEPTELELAQIKIAQLEDALKKTEMFKPARQLTEEEAKAATLQAMETGLARPITEDEFYRCMKSKDNGTNVFFYDSYGIKLFKDRILPQMTNAGVKSFRRLYFEV